MLDGGVIWFDLVGLWTRRTGIFSLLVNRLSFLNQLPDELADGGITKIITHIVCAYKFNIIILVFQLVIEMQMCGRVIFWSADNHFFDPNSTAEY